MIFKKLLLYCKSNWFPSTDQWIFHPNTYLIEREIDNVAEWLQQSGSSAWCCRLGSHAWTGLRKSFFSPSSGPLHLPCIAALIGTLPPPPPPLLLFLRRAGLLSSAAQTHDKDYTWMRWFTPTTCLLSVR